MSRKRQRVKQANLSGKNFGYLGHFGKPSVVKAGHNTDFMEPEFEAPAVEEQSFPSAEETRDAANEEIGRQEGIEQQKREQQRKKQVDTSPTKHYEADDFLRPSGQEKPPSMGGMYRR